MAKAKIKTKSKSKTKSKTTTESNLKSKLAYLWDKRSYRFMSLSLFIIAIVVILAITAGCSKQQFQDAKQTILRPFN